MAESRQLSVRLSDETFAALESLRPAGASLAEVARRVLEKALRTGLGQLPALQAGPRGPVQAEVDLSPLLAAISTLQLRQDEAQRETVRAVHEHGSWARRRHKTDAVLDQLAKDDGEQLVRDWERSVGR